MEELDTEVTVGEWIETIEYDYPMFHLSMRQKEEEPDNVAGKHEELLEKWLEILFYGVIEKEQ